MIVLRAPEEMRMLATKAQLCTALSPHPAVGPPSIFMNPYLQLYPELQPGLLFPTITLSQTRCLVRHEYYSQPGLSLT